jgi:hypothetical protein
MGKRRKNGLQPLDKHKALKLFNGILRANIKNIFCQSWWLLFKIKNNELPVFRINYWWKFHNNKGGFMLLTLRRVVSVILCTVLLFLWQGKAATSPAVEKT